MVSSAPTPPSADPRLDSTDGTALADPGWSEAPPAPDPVSAGDEPGTEPAALTSPWWSPPARLDLRKIPPASHAWFIELLSGKAPAMEATA